MEPDFSFGPSGNVSLFNAGIAYYIRKYFKIDYKKATVYCISGGICGLLLMTAKSPDDILERVKKVSKMGGNIRNEPFPPAVLEKYCRELLDIFFDENVHKTIGNRVSLGVTNILTGKQSSINSPFETREDFVEASLVSCYIPFYFLRGFYRNYFSMVDGGFSHTICPTISEDTICINSCPGKNIDLSYEEKDFKHHLSIKNEKELMDTFWLGVERCKSKHKHLEKKLRNLKLIK